jgi:FlaG/FlaF family flagellin (archaellin)
VVVVALYLRLPLLKQAVTVDLAAVVPVVALPSIKVGSATLQQRHQCKVMMVAQVDSKQTTDRAAAAAARLKLVLRDLIQVTAETVAQGRQIPLAA